MVALRTRHYCRGRSEAKGESDSQMLHGTAVARRQFAPWAGSHRVVCADSYFASVSTAEALIDMDLKFIGVVKTATKNTLWRIWQKRSFWARKARMHGTKGCEKNSSDDGAAVG